MPPEHTVLAFREQLALGCCIVQEIVASDALDTVLGEALNTRVGEGAGPAL